MSAAPWAHQLSQQEPEAWAAGRGIVLLCAVLVAWLGSLLWRFTEGGAFAAEAMWLGLFGHWAIVQIYLARAGAPERLAGVYSTIIQAAFPIALTLILAWQVSSFGQAVTSIIAGGS